MTPIPPELFAQARALVEQGDVPGIRALVAAHPGLPGARDRGGTLLHYATGMPAVSWPATAPEVVSVLAEAGADLDAGEWPDGTGETPLIHAVSVDNVGVARRLLELGADPEREGRHHQGIDTALGYALFYLPDSRTSPRDPDAPTLLLQWGCRVPLPLAAGLGREDALDRDLPDAPPEDRARALVFAAHRGRTAAVRICLTHGVDPSVRTPFFHERFTALHAAAGRGHAGTVEVLLRAGADPTALDERFGGTPAGWARHGGHHAVLAVLERA